MKNQRQNQSNQSQYYQNIKSERKSIYINFSQVQCITPYTKLSKTRLVAISSRLDPTNLQ